MESQPNACPEADLKKWTTYAARLTRAHLPIMEPLFRQICEAVQARGLGWIARVDGKTIGFKAPGGERFKIAVHSDAAKSEPPSLLIHPGKPLADLGLANPYPDLPMFWLPKRAAQGWSVFGAHRIPDVGIAVELAVDHGQP
jgi:hypothetical protein